MTCGTKSEVLSDSMCGVWAVESADCDCSRMCGECVGLKMCGKQTWMWSNVVNFVEVWIYKANTEGKREDKLWDSLDLKVLVVGSFKI